MAEKIGINLLKTKDGLYKFRINSNSGMVLFTSEGYTSKKTALDNVTQFINAIENNSYVIRLNLDDFRNTVINVRVGKKIISSSPYLTEGEAKDAFEVLKVTLQKKPFEVERSVKENVNDNDSRISSVSDFVNKVSRISRKRKHTYYFRGHANYQYELVPGIYRSGKNWINSEHKLYREIMLKCPTEFKGNITAFQNLVKMQHYSLPTRLLDITTNALIALYFSCSSSNAEEKRKDGEVVVFNIMDSDVKYFDDSAVSLLSNISKQDYLFSSGQFSLRTSEGEAHGNNKIYKFKHGNKQQIMDAVRRDGCYIDSEPTWADFNRVICVKPEMDNPRIIRQDGAFLLFGMDGEKKMPPKIPDEYHHIPSDGRLIIKFEEKEKIINELESLGISASSVYPEIEHVASHFKVKYS